MSGKKSLKKIKKVVDFYRTLQYNIYCVTGKAVTQNRRRGVAQLG